MIPCSLIQSTSHHKIDAFLPRPGGLSYFSARFGFVCDNVVNYEIVLASGEIVNANATSNPDLWVSLRGGSNNSASSHASTSALSLKVLSMAVKSSTISPPCRSSCRRLQTSTREKDTTKTRV